MCKPNIVYRLNTLYILKIYFYVIYITVFQEHVNMLLWLIKHTLVDQRGRLNAEDIQSIISVQSPTLNTLPQVSSSDLQLLSTELLHPSVNLPVNFCCPRICVTAMLPQPTCSELATSSPFTTQHSPALLPELFHFRYLLLFLKFSHSN